jgi:O-antigen/teichoic acid export membrane protein
MVEILKNNKQKVQEKVFLDFVFKTNNPNIFFLKIVETIKQDKFLVNSSIFFIGSFLVGVGNYFYQFLMARMLPIELYGELQSLLAIFAIISVVTSLISMLMVKYTAAFKAKGWLNKIYTLFLDTSKKISIGALIFFLIFLFFSRYLANFLNLTSVLPVIILGISFLFIFLSSVNNGILQGLQKFKELSIIGMIGVFFKILLAVLLVKIGLALSGAVGAIVLAGLLGYLISFLPLKFLFKQQREKIEMKEIFQYSFSVFLTLLFLILLYNLDIVLVKHFFSAQRAGEYGALTMLGHLIFFISAPFAGVMFPMTAAAYSANHDSVLIFKKGIFLTVVVGLIVLLFYFFFPNFIIKVLIGSKFLSISKWLGWFGLSMFLYSLVNLFSQYFLSINQFRFLYIIGIGVFLQMILISLFNNHLWQVIWVMNGVMVIILFLLLIFYFKTKET